MQKQKPETRTSIVGKYIGWIAIRVAVIVVLFVLLETAYRFGAFEFAGTEETQFMIYSALQKVVFSGVVWFFLAASKNIIIPAIIITLSPAMGKIVRDKRSRQRTNKSISQYLTYLIYFTAIIAVILIWAYSFIGTWVANVLGTGLVVALTFILGLFTSSVLGNVLAYSILGGTNEFKEGDRVQIGDSYGDIEEIGFFFTRIRTIKDEIISVPNLMVMNKEIRNFSALKEVLIYVQVTLGYDIDKEQAKKLLIEGALKTKGIISVPNKAPFVLLRDLGNYSITYEINAYTDKPNDLINIKSELINNILDEFKHAGVEIMSPNHVAIRDSARTVPPPLLPPLFDSAQTKHQQ
ncbi:MAG: mechanosensitive ion channel family protein [Candidatus Bathyarchaeota archaeon]|nr:mechanosensitive ion channel family protein [Candidatus Bathyarchaeota archaeon]